MISVLTMNGENYLDAAEIEQECFSDRPWTAEQFGEEISLEFSRTFIAYDGDRAAGFVNMWLTPPFAVINNIAVREQYRRKGIGTELIRKALSECGECSSLTLEVRVSNEGAIAFYERHGFTQVGRRKNFYENPCEDAFIMTKFKKKGE